jgi:hypothetical protein
MVSNFRRNPKVTRDTRLYLGPRVFETDDLWRENGVTCVNFCKRLSCKFLCTPLLRILHSDFRRAYRIFDRQPSTFILFSVSVGGIFPSFGRSSGSEKNGEMYLNFKHTICQKWNSIYYQTIRYSKIFGMCYEIQFNTAEQELRGYLIY